MSTAKPMNWKAWIQSKLDERTCVVFFQTPADTAIEGARDVGALLMGHTLLAQYVQIEEVNYSPKQVLTIVPGDLDVNFVHLIQSLLEQLDILENQYEQDRIDTHPQMNVLKAVLAEYGTLMKPQHGYALQLDGQRFTIYTDTIIGSREL